ncbi:MAG: LpxI family protein [Phyllobacteriaceae bacterium]|nr:LpxI family protein [Phyllobacteriaceae bacterium]
MPALRKAGVAEVVFAGGIVRRPKMSALRVPFSALPGLPAVLRQFWAGDNGLLSALVRMTESYGIAVVGAHQILPDHVATHGQMGQIAAPDLQQNTCRPSSAPPC